MLLQLIPQTSQFSGEFMPVSLVTSAPSSPRNSSEIARRRIEYPIAPKPPSGPDVEEKPVERTLSPTPSISAFLQEHDPMIDLGGADNNFPGELCRGLQSTVDASPFPIFFF